MSSRAIPELEVPVGVQLSPVDVTQLSGVRIKAFSLLALEEVATAQFGASVVAEWRKSHTFDFASMTATAWIPVEYRYHLTEYLVSRYLDGDPQRAWELGSLVAQKEISAFFRFVLRFTSPSLVLSMSSRFWRSFYDRCEFVVVDSGPGFVHAEIRDWPLMSAPVAYEIAGALREWMLASRATDLRVLRLAWLKPGLLRLESVW
jgi:hypothetical protein